ncbi:MAG: DNA-binding response regulator [Bacteroidetes bacterium]|nr:MAG: DNA-binding response regulator [Bacteroidota bacterium]
MNILIFEDEALAAERLARLCQRYDPQMQPLAQLASVEEAVAWLQGHEMPDLIFADIQLVDGLCFEIFRTVPVSCPVIFTTSYDQYALEAFAVHSIDYLLKPLRYEKLAQALDKLASLRQELSSGAPPAPEIDLDELAARLLAREPAFKSRFLVRNGPNIRAVKTEEIAYFYSDRKLTLLVSREGRRFPVDYSLDRLSEMIDPRSFFRANRQFLVHVDAVQVIHPYFKGRLKLELDPPIDEEVVVSSDKTPLFKEWLDQ